MMAVGHGARARKPFARFCVRLFAFGLGCAFLGSARFKPERVWN